MDEPTVLAQFYIWMYADKLKSEIVTNSESISELCFIRVSDKNPFSHRYVEAN